MNAHTMTANGRWMKLGNSSGAEARPVTRLQDGAVVLDAVQVESDHPGHGRGVLYLTPDQLLYIQARLSQIAVAFLHENRWGGEDARDQ